jgi:hypothetical protein
MDEAKINRFPLAWPMGWKRTAAGARQWAKFSKRVTGSYGYKTNQPLSVAQAVQRLADELRKMGVGEDWLISSNVRVRLDGMPYSNDSPPQDPGVAVYFKIKGKPRVLACDKWARVADNIAAVAGHVEAIRAQDRYGVGTLDQAFAGYTAIPARTGGADWRAEMGFESRPIVTQAEVDTRYQKLARARHPDLGGSHEAMARLNEARQAYLDEHKP